MLSRLCDLVLEDRMAKKAPARRRSLRQLRHARRTVRVENRELPGLPVSSWTVGSRLLVREAQASSCTT